MGEYTSKKRAESRSEQNNAAQAQQTTNGIPNSVMADVFAGKRAATSEMMGRRSTLAPSIAAKMSQAFGMDVSGVQVYRSDAMAGSAMHGMASGSKVVLSSDVDLNTMEGQAILGHELSHIRTQSQGIGTGSSGLLQNASLEHQADAEGMMAARGMNISGESMGMNMGLGMAGVENLTPVGPGMGASAGAPMQANKDDADIERCAANSGDYKKYNAYMNRVKKNSASETPTVDDMLDTANGSTGGTSEARFVNEKFKKDPELWGGSIADFVENFQQLLDDVGDDHELL